MQTVIQLCFLIIYHSATELVKGRRGPYFTQIKSKQVSLTDNIKYIK